MFSNIKPLKTFIIFSAIFFVGCFSIWGNYSPVIIPSSLIALYGIYLYIAQSKYFVDLLDSEKNSPYFLGFLFTLFALFHLFINPIGLNEDLIFKNLSIALLTTIVGLLFRQLNFSFSTLPEDEAEVMRSMREQLTSSINKYHEAQSKIIGLVKNFAEAKIRILSDEKEISDKYIRTLEDATGVLEKFEQQYVEKITVLSTSFSEYINNFQKSVKEVIPDNFKEEIADKLELFHSDYINKLNEGLDNFIGTLNRISDVIVKKGEEEYLAALTDSSDMINSTCKDYSSNVGLYSLQLEEDSKKVSIAYNSIFSQMNSYAEKSKEFGADFEKVTTSLSNQFNMFETQMGNRLEQFKNELDSVNKLINAFLTAMDSKIAKI